MNLVNLFFYDFPFFNLSLSEIEILFYNRKRFSFNPFLLWFFTDAIPESQS